VVLAVAVLMVPASMVAAGVVRVSRRRRRVCGAGLCLRGAGCRYALATATRVGATSHDSAATQEPDGRLSPDHQVARADEPLAQAAAAAGRIAAEHAERQARAEYTARADREAQAQREPTLERQAQCDVEIELQVNRYWPCVAKTVPVSVGAASR